MEDKEVLLPESEIYQEQQTKMIDEIEILLPKDKNTKKIVNDLINAFELSIYKKKIKNISLNINLYSNKQELDDIIQNKSISGKIFIGPLTSNDIINIDKHCEKNIMFFSFASDQKYAGNCIYLINFFPEDDLLALFNKFPEDSRVALLYPENDYGYYINSIIDPIATESKSIIINRASYNENLSNAREAIKELSKFELRKYELERQKKILKNKNDVISKKALKKIEKFETVGVVEFTHLILPDYNIRLLQIAPLLPFYDIDPSNVQFVGTGVWDNEAFFNEPSLQGAIFPGISKNRRNQFFNDYYSTYNQKPSRTITIAYDLIGIISYIINKKLTLSETHSLLSEEQTTFDGIDGKFSFRSNIISRKLDILRISNGKAELIN